jgi:PAS domain S-box-containing protein
MPPSVRYPVRVALLAVVYFAAARLGLAYASIGHSVSLIWPPTGIALAALILLGDRYWPGIAAGAFLANLLSPIPATAAAGIALGNTAEALVGAYLFRRLAGPEAQLENLRAVRAFVLVAAPLAALVSALVGVSSLIAVGALDNVSAVTVVAIWWAGDLVGALVVAPVFLAWSRRPRPAESPRRIIEVFALCVGSALAAELALAGVFHLPILREIDYTYLLFPFVVWASLRFGARGGSLLTLTIAAITLWHTVRGGGPFLAHTTTATLVATSCYLAAVALTGLILSAAVVWEREQATTALRRREDQLRLTLNAARMGTWFWSVERNQLIWDDNLKRLYGLAPHENPAGYEEFLVRVHPDDRGFVRETVQKALEGGGGLDYEFRILLPDGRVRWIADQGEVGRDAAGRVAYMTGVCLDVTDRKLDAERMQHAHRMESVGRLAGGVAHEANNQMTVVLGATDFILRSGRLADALREDVEQIRNAAERTAAVTSQLLAFSRRQILKLEVLDLNAVIRNWEPVLRRVLEQHSSVVIHLAPGVGRIKADPGQLEQILLNLALNARDAMPDGGRVTIETFAAELTDAYAKARPEVAIRPGCYTVLVVSDTGHGMGKHVADHIFEPFFTTKPVGRGSGLGLSVVYGIVKQSEGYIWAYSEPGKGATFKIYLPLTDEEPPPPVSANAVPAPVFGETILVVEDEGPVRGIVRRALEAAGYVVLQAESGAEAIELLTRATKPVHLVLTDVVMPGMSGRELAQRVAQLAPGKPVIFMSGYTSGEVVRRGLLDADAEFLQKPFAPETVVGVVRRALERRSRTRAGTSL